MGGVLDVDRDPPESQPTSPASGNIDTADTPSDENLTSGGSLTSCLFDLGGSLREPFYPSPAFDAFRTELLEDEDVPEITCDTVFDSLTDPQYSSEDEDILPGLLDSPSEENSVKVSTSPALPEPTASSTEEIDIPTPPRISTVTRIPKSEPIDEGEFLDLPTAGDSFSDSGVLAHFLEEEEAREDSPPADYLNVPSLAPIKKPTPSLAAFLAELDTPTTGEDGVNSGGVADVSEEELAQLLALEAQAPPRSPASGIPSDLDLDNLDFLGPANLDLPPGLEDSLSEISPRDPLVASSHAHADAHDLPPDVDPDAFDDFVSSLVSDSLNAKNPTTISTPPSSPKKRTQSPSKRKLRRRRRRRARRDANGRRVGVDTFDRKKLLQLDKKQIGRGAYGVVTRGVIMSGVEGEEIEVAVKQITVQNKKHLSRVVHEIEIHRALIHPNVLKVFGAFFEGAEAFVISEFCPNGDLHDYCRLPRIHRSWRKKMVLIYGVARGMRYLHTEAIVHRDLKPKNILVGEDSKVRICDFGESRNEATCYGTFVGTPAYIPPETVASSVPEIPDCHATDAKLIDIYAFGLIIWSVWAGEEPHRELIKRMNNPYTVLREIHVNMVRPSLEEVPTMPIRLISLMQQCWAHSGLERPESFDIILTELKTITAELKAGVGRLGTLGVNLVIETNSDPTPGGGGGGDGGGLETPMPDIGQSVPLIVIEGAGEGEGVVDYSPSSVSQTEEEEDGEGRGRENAVEHNA